MVYMNKMILAAALLSCPALMNAGNGGDNGTDSNPDTLRASVVTGTRVSMLRDQISVPVSIVPGEAISASDESALMPVLMEQVPGLFVTNRGVTGYGVSTGAAGAISLRGFGAASGRVLILIDGHPQFESIYGHPVADEYLAMDAARVEVSRGASSVLYGSNAMGGAINILTRKAARNGNALDLKLAGGSYGTFRGRITDSWKQGPLSVTAGFNCDRTDGHRDNSAFSSLGGLLGASYEISGRWKASARLSLMQADSQNPGTVAKPMLEGSSDVTRAMMGVSLENTYEKSSGSIDIYYNWGNHVIDDGYAEGGSPQPYLFHGKDFTAGVSAWQSLEVFKGNRITAGTDLMYYGGNAYRNPRTEIYADHKRLDEEAVYIFDNQAVGNMNLTAGIRLDRHSSCGVQWIPHFGASWMPGPGTSLKASVSKGFRIPNMRELYMYVVANEELKPEEAWSCDFTAGHHFLDGALNLEASIFRTRGSNIIEVTVVDGKRQNRNAGDFSNSGIELAADWKVLPGLNLNANYSYLKMKKIYTGAPVHKGWLGARWDCGRFSAKLGAMFISGLYLNTGDNERKSSYTDLSLRLAWRLSGIMSVFVRGMNLLNDRYETMEGFPEAGFTALGGISLSL